MESGATAAPYMLDMQILLTAVVAATWWALYRPLLAQDHYRWWAWGWTAFLFFLVGARLGFTGDLDPRATLLVHLPAALLQVTFFALGAESLRRGGDLDTRESLRWVGLAAGTGLLLAYAYFPHEQETLRITARTLTRSPGLALALGYCGWLFLKKRRGERSTGVVLVAGGFLLYALDQAVYAVAGFNQAFSIITDTGTGGLGVDLLLQDAFIVADMAWEAAIGMGAIILLVEEKNRLYLESRRHRRQLEALFAESVDGILVASADGRVRSANPAALEMLGWDEDEITGLLLSDLVSEDDGELPLSYDEIRERGGLTLETSSRTAAGMRLPVELSLSAYDIAGARRLQVIMRDISTRKALIEQLTHRATHDPLTDLPNRQYVFDELQRMLAMMDRGEARPAVLFLDLDEFKQVNDTYGHSVGDSLLVSLSRRLRRTVRETELVGHLGGDEFVVLVPWCESESDLRKIGRRIADAMSEPYSAEGHELHVSASVGGALASEGDTAEGLVQKADRAMYLAKSRREQDDAPIVVSTGG